MGLKLLRMVALLTVLGLLKNSDAVAEDWPCYRGPSGQGHTQEKGLPVTWNGKTGENILWKVPAPRRTIRSRR